MVVFNHAFYNTQYVQVEVDSLIQVYQSLELQPLVPTRHDGRLPGSRRARVTRLQAR